MLYKASEIGLLWNVITFSNLRCLVKIAVRDVGLTFDESLEVEGDPQDGRLENKLLKKLLSVKFNGAAYQLVVLQSSQEVWLDLPRIVFIWLLEG